MYQIDIYCNKNIITTQLLYVIFRTHLHFIPNRVGFKKISKAKISSYSQEDLELVLSKEGGDLYIDNDTSKEFQTLNFVGSRSIIDALHISKSDSGVEEWVLDKVILKNGFIVAYEYDTDFHTLQNETSLSNLKAYGLDVPDGLFCYKDKFTPRINIDIRNNPYKGFWDEGKQINITIAWRMWFSKFFIEKILQKNVEGFNGFYEKKWISDTVFFIQMFENIEDCAIEENLAFAQTFRTFLGIDELLPTHLRYDKSLAEKWESMVDQYNNSDDSRIW